jgi:hypothetical protein
MKVKSLVGWRQHLKVHPTAELFPLISPAEIKELGDDIRARGLLHPIVLWRDADGYSLLDGRNRLDAMEAADIEVPAGVEAMLAEMSVTIREAPTDPYDYVISANVRRRHLTAEQKRDLIAELLKRRPDKSDRQIGKQVGASPSTVGDERKKQEESGLLSKLDRRIDARGRQRPAHNPRPVKTPPAPSQPPAPQADNFMTGVSEASPPVDRDKCTPVLVRTEPHTPRSTLGTAADLLEETRQKADREAAKAKARMEGSDTEADGGRQHPKWQYDIAPIITREVVRALYRKGYAIIAIADLKLEQLAEIGDGEIADAYRERHPKLH